ncbi:FtsK/SpoIIIE domain-containing protein [Actinomyces minihominis]|uniref:FtsK/SpoIIIE domain-containing protein n=1 Tax=Actinomyces minihominis TaxID=2002838 RepID=UPI000C06CC6D|nr:FtsK/SpoIIIE domain-containing protein [Actinomyces minihominis]
MSSTAQQCLRTEMHLVCTAGPDRGAVVPLRNGVVLGRETLGLSDGAVSRRHARVSGARGRGGHGELALDNLSSTNPLRNRSRGRRLKPGFRFVTGSDGWVVRRRPTDRQWPGGAPLPRSSWRRIGVMAAPFMVVVLLLRLSPSPLFTGSALGALLVAISIILWLRRNHWRGWDEARLLLAASSLTPSSGQGPKTGPITILRVPGRRHLLQVDPSAGPSAPIAVVGEFAERYAWWLALQMHLHGCQVRVQRARVTVQPTTAAVIWAPTVGEVPPESQLVVEAVPVGSVAWLRQVQEMRATAAKIPHLVGLEVVLDGAAESGRGRVPLGRSLSGTFSVDLEEDGPHTLVVGGTGSGKSELLTTFVLSHALSLSPEELRMVLIDFKGGAGLHHLATLPHVEHSLSDLDATRVPWLLRSLGAVLQARKRILAAQGLRSWFELESAHPRLLVVVDEFHVLAQQHPELMDELVRVAAQGRSLGIHLVLATQRPSGSVTAQLRATLDLRIALRCGEEADSIAAIGSGKAAQLPRVPGRALVRGEEIQTAYSPDAERWIEKVKSRWGRSDAFPKVVPDPLPDNVEVQPGFLGVFEVPGRSVAQLPDPGGSMAIQGPQAVRLQLSELARGVLQSRAQPVALWIDAESALGPATRDLCELLRFPFDAPAPLVVIDGVSRFLTRLEEVALPDRVRALWERLLSAEAQGGLQLIATDTRSRFDLSTLGVRVLHLPDRRHLLSHDLAAALPTTVPGSGGLPVVRANDLAPYCSPLPGRVLIQGVSEDEVAWAQMPLVKGHGLERGAAGGLRRRSSASALPEFAGGPMWVIGQDLERIGLTGSEAGLRVLDGSQWPSLVGHLSGTVLAFEPPRDLCRLLTQHFPDDAVWLAASQPFRRGQGLFAHEEMLHFFDDTDTPTHLLQKLRTAV